MALDEKTKSTLNFIPGLAKPTGDPDELARLKQKLAQLETSLQNLLDQVPNYQVGGDVTQRNKYASLNDINARISKIRSEIDETKSRIYQLEK